MRIHHLHSRLSRCFLALAVSAMLGCGRSDALQNRGSDTMVEAAHEWAKAYYREKGEVVEVSGGGSGVGITALIDGTVHIANASRKIKEREAENFRKKHPNLEPVEFVVGYDALAVYVHKDNPIEEITLEQLGEIFKQDGKITKWSQLGIKVPGCDSDEISPVSRANSSGTYLYFKEYVLGKGADYRKKCITAIGSRDLVQRCGQNQCAIGYSGMGYKTDAVKFVKVKTDAGSAGIEPSVAAVLDKTYPIARPLFMYTIGQPEGKTKVYIDWVRSDTGQALLEKIGYVPLDASERTKVAATPETK